MPDGSAISGGVFHGAAGACFAQLPNRTWDLQVFPKTLPMPNDVVFLNTKNHTKLTTHMSFRNTPS